SELRICVVTALAPASKTVALLVGIARACDSALTSPLAPRENAPLSPSAIDFPFDTDGVPAFLRADAVPWVAVRSAETNCTYSRLAVGGAAVAAPEDWSFWPAL